MQHDLPDSCAIRLRGLRAAIQSSLVVVSEPRPAARARLSSTLPTRSPRQVNRAGSSVSPAVSCRRAKCAEKASNRSASNGSPRNFAEPLAVMPFDEAAVWAYGALRADLERRGTPIGALNTLIAAHALSQQALLVTHNTREFTQVPSLQRAGWAAAP